MENNIPTNFQITNSLSLKLNRLLLINKLLNEQSIDSITVTEFEAFTSLFSNIFLNAFQQKPISVIVSQIIKSSSRYSLKSTNDSQIKMNKVMIISIITLFHLRNKYQSLIKFESLFAIIGKLYNEDYLITSDLNSYFIILIRLGLIDLKDTIFFEKRTLFNQTFDLLTKAVVIDCKRNKSDLIIETLSFFKKEVVDEERDLFFLSKSMTYFKFGCSVYQSVSYLHDEHIRETVIAKLNEVIIPIYQSKFSIKLMKNHMNIIKDSILNYNTKSREEVKNNLLASRYQMQFLTNCSSFEQNKEKVDLFQINRGFIFNGDSKKGLKANINTQLKNFTIIFSFKLIPSSSSVLAKKTYPILSFISPENNNANILGFSINSIDNYLCFTITTEQEQKDIKEINIVPFQSYLFIITGYPSSSIYKINIKYNKMQISNFNINKIKDKSTICYIGYRPQLKNDSNDDWVFQGEIGTVIILKDILSDQIIFNMFNLKGNYDNFFYASQYDTSYISKYINIITVNDKFYPMALNCFDRQAPSIMEMTTFIISPLTFQLAYNDKGLEYLTKYQYKFNYLNINQNELRFQEKIDLLCYFFDEFTIFERNSTVFELLKRDGFKFITLHLEYYYSLLVENKDLHLNQLKGLM